MPIHEYMCKDCGHTFEEIAPFDPTNSTIECPHCETNTAIRLPSAPGGYNIRGNNGASTPPKRRYK